MDAFTGFSGWSVGSPFYILPRGTLRLTWRVNGAWAKGSGEQCSCDGEWVGMPAKLTTSTEAKTTGPPQPEPPLPRRGGVGLRLPGGSHEGSGDSGLGREARRLLVQSFYKSPGLGNYGNRGATSRLGFETLNY